MNLNSFGARFKKEAPLPALLGAALCETNEKEASPFVNYAVGTWRCGDFAHLAWLCRFAVDPDGALS